MNTIRNFTIYQESYIYHLHRDLFYLTNKLLRARFTKNLQTHIGKVQSHTDIEYNESADSAVRAVVDGESTTDITFEYADPPIGGLRTWPQIRHTTPNKQISSIQLPTLRRVSKKQLKQPSTSP